MATVLAAGAQAFASVVGIACRSCQSLLPQQQHNRMNVPFYSSQLCPQIVFSGAGSVTNVGASIMAARGLSGVARSALPSQMAESTASAESRVNFTIADNRRLLDVVCRVGNLESGELVAAQPIQVMVNSVTGKMGLATAEAVVARGLTLVPYSLMGRTAAATGKVVDVMGVVVQLVTKDDAVWDRILSEYPNMIVVDYTVPDAVNDNAEFYCSKDLPFVMGTTGGDRVKLMKDVLDSGNYAVIAPQMGKQVVAFQAAIDIMGEQFPGAFSGYKLQVTESHQSTKVDTSGTAKAIGASFAKLGLDFDVSKVDKIRDPQQQKEKMKVPESHLAGHAFHTYQVVSPDSSVSFEFQHNVCGRSIYAEGTVDAVLFLATKVLPRDGRKSTKSETEKRVFDMIDVLREGNMT